MRSAPFVTLVAAVAVFAAVPALAGQQVSLASHRAVYELSLADGATSKTIEGARGRILYEFTGSACEGYAQTFGQVVELSGGDIGTRVTATRSTTFEDGDGGTLRFNTQNRDASGDTDETDGTAERKAGAIKVTLRKPEKKSLDLTEALFPTAHIKAVIEAARAGETTFSANVYDGSEKGVKYYETFAVIGKPVAEGAEAVEEPLKAAGWDKVPRWPVSISYFEPGASNQTPVYVVSFELLDNGVSRKLKLDYGEFALKGDMTRLETLKANPCDK
ncbi:cell envelope integrity EipB family protein [Alsobacter sp. R-9]